MTRSCHSDNIIHHIAPWVFLGIKLSIKDGSIAISINKTWRHIQTNRYAKSNPKTHKNKNNQINLTHPKENNSSTTEFKYNEINEESGEDFKSLLVKSISDIRKI